MTEVLFKDESYKIVGIIYKVYNELGFGYQEKYYYRPIKDELIQAGFSVKEQLLTPLLYNDKSIGRYFLDFLINGCIVLEIKVANQVYPRHIKQVLGYLKANNLKLGIIAVLNKDGVIIKRVLNER
jgi:GxxExxY protein